MLTPRSTPSLAILLASLALVGACGSLNPKPDDPRDLEGRSVGWLVDHGEYAEALRIAEAAHRKRPEDTQAERDYRIATVALLLARGRMDLFEDRDEEALEHFLEAQALAPKDPIVANWVLMTRQKLAKHFEYLASDHHIADELDDAIVAYERALAYDPTYQPARSGLARALLQVNHRQGMGRRYYEDGIAAFHDLWLEQANASFSYSLKYTPEDERAGQRHAEVQEQLAIQRVTIGLQLEEEGRFAAARNEFRMALLLDANNPLALGGLTRMTVESQAAEHLREAERAYLRSDYPAAEEAVALARSMTARLEYECDQLENAVESSRLGEIYERGRILENDQRFEEAIDVYEELLEQAPYFRDAIARRDTLEDYVAEAARLYESAAAAETPVQEGALLRRIYTFWPEYLDVSERLARLPVAPVSE